jgi:hypothetical protein
MESSDLSGDKKADAEEAPRFGTSGLIGNGPFRW